MITAADHLGELDCDQTGQASVVEVRGTVHWLTHADGPARALSVHPAARARLPRVLGRRPGRLGHRRQAPTPAIASGPDRQSDPDLRARSDPRVSPATAATVRPLAEACSAA